MTAETVDIRLKITFKDGWNWADILQYVESAIDKYFTELAAGWDKVDWRDDHNATLVVRVSQIEMRILGLTGVLDVANITLNGQADNLILGVDNIAVRGAVTNEL